MAAGVLLEPYMSQGGQGVAETPIVSKGLRTRHFHKETILNLVCKKFFTHKYISPFKIYTFRK